MRFCTSLQRGDWCGENGLKTQMEGGYGLRGWRSSGREWSIERGGIFWAMMMVTVTVIVLLKSRKTGTSGRRGLRVEGGRILRGSGGNCGGSGGRAWFHVYFFPQSVQSLRVMTIIRREVGGLEGPSIQKPRRRVVKDWKFSFVGMPRSLRCLGIHPTSAYHETSVRNERSRYDENRASIIVYSLHNHC